MAYHGPPPSLRTVKVGWLERLPADKRAYRYRMRQVHDRIRTLTPHVVLEVWGEDDDDEWWR